GTQRDPVRNVSSSQKRRKRGDYERFELQFGVSTVRSKHGLLLRLEAIRHGQRTMPGVRLLLPHQRGTDEPEESKQAAGRG
ncbi:MAG: hypothetical protein ACXABY_34740, partial [Candidatus Thorarchaeota archaeon]